MAFEKIFLSNRFLRACEVTTTNITLMSDSGSASLEEICESKMASPSEDLTSSIDIEEKDKSGSDPESLEVKSTVGTVGFFPTTMNMLNCLLGAGILSIPNTFIDSGIVVSVILLLIVAGITHFATVLTFELCHDLGAEGIDDMARRTLGKWGLISLSACCLIFNICSCLAYLIIGADFIISWFAAAGIDLSSSIYRAIVVFVYSVLIPIALSIPKSFTFLSYFSTVTFGCIVLFVIVLLYEAISKLPKQGISPTIVIAKIDIDFFSSISIYGTAFSLPLSCMPVIHDFDPNVKKRNSVSAISLITCFIVMVIPGICGYLIFGDQTNGNILNSFSDNDIVMIVVRVGFFLVVTFSYPIVAPCVACSFSELIYHVNQANDLTGKRRGIIFFLTHIFTLVLAIFLPSMKPALEVGGAIGGCLGNFSIPGIMWLVATKLKMYHWKCISAMLLAIFGIVSGIVSTYTSIISAISAFKTVKF